MKKLGGIRTKIALLYSILLFGLASIVLGVIYVSFPQSLSDSEVTQQNVETESGGLSAERLNGFEELLLFEEKVNQNAVEQLRDYILIALAGLLLISLMVGWYAAGIVLKPMKHISFAAREISATDLSKRIALKGPCLLYTSPSPRDS